MLKAMRSPATCRAKQKNDLNKIKRISDGKKGLAL